MAPSSPQAWRFALALIATLFPWHRAAAQEACPRLSDSSAATLLATDARLWSPWDRGKEPTDPIILRDLACTRWALWRTEVVARERSGMPLGSSWLEGAATVAWLGLRAPVVAPEVAAVVAALAATEPLALTRENRLVAIREARGRANEPAAALALDRACIVLGARLPTHAASVLECARAGASADPAGSEWYVAEAHALAHLADTMGAWTAWQAALDRSRSAADWQRIEGEVRWFATPAELTALEATPLAERAQAVVQLFDQRDLRSGAARGTFFTTFATRLSRARQEFGLRISRSQVQRFLTGAPSTSSLGQTVVDTTGIGDTDWRELVRWQTEIDDRGIIFIRHGEPDLRRTPATEERALEIWAYTRTTPPLFFQFEEEDFDRSVAATRLTIGRYNDHWCGIDTLRCIYATREELMKSSPSGEQVARLREQDRQIIAAAMSTDTPEERGEPLPPLLARAHRLWDPVSWEPILLVAYALPWPVPRAADPPLSVDLRLAWWGATQRDTAFTRQHAPPSPESQGGGRGSRYAVGFVTLARDTATTSWRMQAVTAKTTRQAVGSGVRQGQREGITLSDLVIGNDESPLRWSVRGEPVAVDPGVTLRADLPISVFYQIRSEGPTRMITSRFRVARLGAREGERTDLIDVSLISELEPGLQQIAPTLDPRFLTPGDYGLELRVLSEDGVELAVATTSFRIAAPPKTKEP